VNKGNTMTKITKEFIAAALELADIGQSKLTEREREIFGLSSVRLKAFLNNICSKPDTKYLELGVYKGSTIISAVFGNPTCKAMGVENFKYDEREPKKLAPEGTIWTNMKSQLEDNISRYVSSEKIKADAITIIESDFRDLELEKSQKFDVCLFDVSPSTAEMYDDFFTKIYPHMALESVVIFMNYSNETTARMIQSAVEKYSDKFTITASESRISSGLSDATKYYSGILVLGTKKKITK